MSTDRFGRPAPRRTGETAAQPPGMALSIFMLFAILAIVFAFAAAGGAVTAANLDSWYESIAKSSLTPADWVFPIVWNFLFFLMGISGWLVWRTAGGVNEAGAELALFFAQLAFNFGWSIIFFGLHRPGLAMIEIVVLDLCIAATACMFWRVNALAGLLLLPYLGWTLFATYLTAAVWALN